jgi:hypothetical protein
VTLADPADGRIAGHLTQGFNIMREQQGLLPHARGGERGLGPGVSATDHYDIEFGWE